MPVHLNSLPGTTLGVNNVQTNIVTVIIFTWHCTCSHFDLFTQTITPKG